MKRFLLITAGILVVLIAELAFNRLNMLINFPFMEVLIFYWFMRLGVAGRVWLAGCAGFVRDSFSALPFGTFIVSYLVLLLIVAGLRLIIEHTKSSGTRMFALSAALGSFFLFVPLVAYFLAGSHTSMASVYNFPGFFYGLIFWAIGTPLFYGSLIYLRRWQFGRV